MSEFPKGVRYYLIGGIFSLIQTAIAFFVNPLIGWIALLLTGFVFLGAILAYRGTIGHYTAPVHEQHLSGDFRSGVCGLTLGPMLIVAIMITFLIPIDGGNFPNILYAIPAFIAGIFTLLGGIQVLMTDSRTY